MNSRNPIYSVIIPHFNDVDGLERLLRSFPVERFDIEVIVVDDCSFDQNVLNRMRSHKCKVRWLSTPENSGAGVARNVGLSAASGAWLVFADSDDEFLPHAFDTLDRVLRDDDQLVYFLADAVQEVDGSPSSRADNMNDLVMAYADARDEPSLQRLRLNHVNPVAKVYARSFIEEKVLRFDSVRRGNDIAFNVLAAINAERIRVEEYSIYRIYRRAGSLTADSSAVAFMERFLVNLSLAQRLAALGLINVRSATGQMLLSLRYGPFVAVRVWWLAIRSPMQIEWSRIFSFGQWRRFLSNQRRNTSEIRK